jgi:hypothetical protein
MVLKNWVFLPVLGFYNKIQICRDQATKKIVSPEWSVVRDMEEL